MEAGAKAKVQALGAATSGSNDPSRDLSVLQAAAKKTGFVEKSCTIWKYAV